MPCDAPTEPTGTLSAVPGNRIRESDGGSRSWRKETRRLQEAEPNLIAPRRRSAHMQQQAREVSSGSLRHMSSLLGRPSGQKACAIDVVVSMVDPGNRQDRHAACPGQSPRPTRTQNAMIQAEPETALTHCRLPLDSPTLCQISADAFDCQRVAHQEMRNCHGVSPFESWAETCPKGASRSSELTQTSPKCQNAPEDSTTVAAAGTACVLACSLLLVVVEKQRQPMIGGRLH